MHSVLVPIHIVKKKNQLNTNICNLFLFCADYPCFKEDGDCFACKLLFTHEKAEAYLDERRRDAAVQTLQETPGASKPPTKAQIYCI